MSSSLKFSELHSFSCLYFFPDAMVVLYHNASRLALWRPRCLLHLGVPFILVREWQVKRSKTEGRTDIAAKGASDGGRKNYLLLRPEPVARPSAVRHTLSSVSANANELAKPMRTKPRRPFRSIPHQRRTTLKSFGLESLRRRHLLRPLSETSRREWHRAYRPDQRKAGGSRLAKQLAWPAATSAEWSMLARPPW